MEIKLTSYGACQEVTGSCHLLNIGGFRLLIDCGLWQGEHQHYLKNWEEFDFDPRAIDAVILTHAHLDHSGRLPKLYRAGYRGKIYGTPATFDLTQVVLDDSHYILAEKARKNQLPLLYDLKDLNKVYQNFQPTNYYQSFRLTPQISCRLHNAGHILGSAIVEVKAGGKTIVFSGDIGSENMPLVKNIDYLKTADYVVCESTYGDRRHEDIRSRDQKLLAALQRTIIKRSTLLIAIFAIERTQDILKVLNDYYEKHLDFNVPVFLDSPMAYQATKIYKNNLEYLNQAAQDELKHDRDIFDFPHLKITNDIKKSKKINTVNPPKVILAGSGMMEGGRIIHHLARSGPEANNNILFMGFQVPGTLGYKILNGAFDFDYYGRRIPLKAATDQIDGFSAHADQAALIKWLRHFDKPRQILLSHGDRKVEEKFRQKITNRLKSPALIIKEGQTIILK